MVRRRCVATNANIPISRSSNAGAGASGDDRAVQASCRRRRARLVQRGMQRHERLLVVRTSSRGATDLEMKRTILPEDIVGRWDTILRGSFVQESSAGVAGGTSHRVGRSVVSCGLFGDAESPAGCGAEAVQAPLALFTHVPGGGDWSLDKPAK